MIYIIILALVVLYLIGSYVDDLNEKNSISNQMKEYRLKTGDEVVYVGNEENSKITKLYYGEIYKVYDEDAEYISVYNNRKDPRTGDIIGINLKEDFIKL